MAVFNALLNEYPVDTILKYFLDNDHFVNPELSYAHANGFKKIVLFESERPNGVKLRLHTWSKPLLPEECDIHNHRWSFVSHLIEGKQHHTHYSFDQSENGLDYKRVYRYVSKQGGLKFSLDQQEAIRLKKNFEMECVTGSKYYLDQDVLHHVIPERLPCSSLVLHHTASKAQTTVVSDIDKKAGVYEMLPMSKKQIMNELTGVQNRCGYG